MLDDADNLTISSVAQVRPQDTKQGVHWMSDHLVYLARTSRFGERNASRKLAMIALCNAASDKGEAIEMGAAEIAEAAELADVKSAMRVRRELVNLGLVEIVDGDGEKPLPGQGRGAKGIYKVNVARLKALHEGDWDYLVEARKLRTEKGSVTPPKETDTCDAEMPPVKGGGMGVSKGVAMGVSEGVSASTSSIKDSTNYWIDDVPNLQLPGWSVEAVKQLEPERWAVLAEAYLRWPKARKAVDIGNAFIGWAKSVLGIEKPGKGRITSRADWGMIYAMAGLSPEEARRGNVALPTGAALAARGGGHWRDRLRNTASPQPAEPAPR